MHHGMNAKLDNSRADISGPVGLGAAFIVCDYIEKDVFGVVFGRG